MARFSNRSLYRHGHDFPRQRLPLYNKLIKKLNLSIDLIFAPSDSLRRQEESYIIFLYRIASLLTEVY